MCHSLARLKKYIDYKGLNIAAFEKSVGMSNASFGKQLKKNGSIGADKLENILSVYTDLSPEWLMTGEGEMLRSRADDVPTPSHHTLRETRPRIPLDAAAGSLSLIANAVTEADCERFPVVQNFPAYDFTIMVRGDSMEPNFLSGDEIACRFIKQSSFIQWGRPHLLDTAQGIVLKRIYNRPDSILCKSDNEDYEDFEIPKNEILHIALVVGTIRIY